MTPGDRPPSLLDRVLGTGHGRFFAYRVRFLLVLILAIVLVGLVTGKL